MARVREDAGRPSFSLGVRKVKLYTKTGDAGETSLADGRRVGKDDLRPETVGTVDELNAHLGLARAACEDASLGERLTEVQRDLFVLGCEVGLAATASPEQKALTVTTPMVERLEAWIDEAMEATPPLTQFVMPGGCETAARLHVARTVCRRAERRMARLARAEGLSAGALMYINRLSDLLYAWARLANHAAGAPDTPVDLRQGTSDEAASKKD